MTACISVIRSSSRTYSNRGQCSATVSETLAWTGTHFSPWSRSIESVLVYELRSAITSDGGRGGPVDLKGCQRFRRLEALVEGIRQLGEGWYALTYEPRRAIPATEVTADLLRELGIEDTSNESEFELTIDDLGDDPQAAQKWNSAANRSPANRRYALFVFRVHCFRGAAAALALLEPILGFEAPDASDLLSALKEEERRYSTITREEARAFLKMDADALMQAQRSVREIAVTAQSSFNYYGAKRAYWAMAALWVVFDLKGMDRSRLKWWWSFKDGGAHYERDFEEVKSLMG